MVKGYPGYQFEEGLRRGWPARGKIRSITKINTVRDWFVIRVQK